MFIFRENWDDKGRFVYWKAGSVPPSAAMDKPDVYSAPKKKKEKKKDTDESAETQEQTPEVVEEMHDIPVNLKKFVQELIPADNEEYSDARDQIFIYLQLVDNFNSILPADIDLDHEGLDYDTHFKSVLDEVDRKKLDKLLKKSKWKKPKKVPGLMEDLKELVFDKLAANLEEVHETEIAGNEAREEFDNLKGELKLLVGAEDLSEELKTKVDALYEDAKEFKQGLDEKSTDDIVTKNAFFAEKFGELFEEYKKDKIKKVKDEYPNAKVEAMQAAETVEALNTAAEAQVSEIVLGGVTMDDYKEFLGKYYRGNDNLSGESIDMLRETYEEVKNERCNELRAIIDSLGEKISADERTRYEAEITNANDEIDPSKFERFYESYKQGLYDRQNPAQAPGEEIVEQLKSPVFSPRWAAQQIAQGNWMAGVFVAIFKFASKFDFMGISSRIANGASGKDWEEAGFERHTEITGERRGNPSLNHMGIEELANYNIQYRDEAENYLERLRIDEDLHFGGDNALMDSLLVSTFTVDKLMGMADEEGNVDETSLPSQFKNTKGTLENLWAKVNEKDPDGEDGTMPLSQFIAENLAEEEDAVAETDEEPTPGE